MAAKKAAGLPLRGRKITLGFGLVNVPVAYKPLAKSGRAIPGKGICPEHGPTLNTQSVCCVGTENEHVLASGEKLIGYPHPDDPSKYVVVEEAVLEEIEESRSGAAAIEKIVDAGQIDPAYFDKTFLVWPQEGAEQAFDLLVAVLRDEGKAAVTTAVLSKQTQMLVFRWSDEFGCLLGHVVKYDRQIQNAEAQLVEQSLASRDAPDPKMIAAAKALLATLEGEFDHAEAADQYTPLLQDAIRAADAGAEFVVDKPVVAETPVLDLMATLQASVAATKPAKKPVAAKQKPAARKKVAA